MKRMNAMLLLSLILLVGCVASKPAATPIPTAAPIATDIPQPTATPTTGQVKGVLITKSTGQAVTAAKANLVPVELGDNGSITFSAELLSERSIVIEVTSGVFLFENVIPGHYLITVNLGGGMPLNTVDDQGNKIVLEVEAGQVIDLGEISVEG